MQNVNMKMSLIEFSVENFKIFKNKVTFSTLSRKGDHTFESNNENLLKTSLIYGPNASGKSTLLDALIIMRAGILNSANNQEGSQLPYLNFILSDEKDKPIFWEVIFSLDNKVFKYNFSILKDKIVTENLIEILSDGKEKEYLSRKEQSIMLQNDLKKSEDVKMKTRKETLFISAASQWNNDLAISIVEGFKKDFNIITGQDSEKYANYTMRIFKENPEMKNKILTFLKKADFCISDGEVNKIEVPEQIKKHMVSMNVKEVPNTVDTIHFYHNKFDDQERNVGSEKINLADESIGTQKFFYILGPIIDTLEKGAVLFIDEFDNSLHPLLTKFIMDIFDQNNPKNAQLIVTTHDTSLLSYKNDFDKSQIWFTEKNKFGVGNLFSLDEFDLRNDTEFSKKYLTGRFGALPFIESI